ncbi:glycoside hydrolase family 36 protein [Aaosphaeria arxii CBS 175.79]|uniref:alpha-galactosidase n=1 Tax=Aaosphaeria arxii CBS 175.79 TaxID=1450172 RepID=A0A6A5XLU0_9PLEO|nr:glycoside hydrolase family 36 protein [Aaosphaeria arxii CBS 175.79]KAF2014205.1 glycoside hydrolase family 36 protein [Aaosphaeria arxii CBS 175.79]
MTRLLVKIPGLVNVSSCKCIPFPRANLENGENTPLLPIHQLRLQGEGNYNWAKSSKALVSTYLSTRLRYSSHREWNEAEANYYEITTQDEEETLKVVSTFTVFDNVPVLRSQTSVQNTSQSKIDLTSIPSLVIGGLTRTNVWYHDFKLSIPHNSWFREAQWKHLSLPDAGVDKCFTGPEATSFMTCSCSNRGTFSTGSYLPMGMLQNETKPDTWLWQLEHNGSWKWEVGDWKSDLYVALSGPTSNDHQWEQGLEPGETFNTVPAAICHVLDGPDAAFQALTAYRRRIRRFHQDNVDLPLIFNDYMNCLMGDPTEDKIRQLIKPATRAGAEYFVIDAGWYSNDNSWWDDIGLWEPSTTRFPSGLDTLIKELRDAGLIPGLWLEPESIGVKSEVANQLPPDAFFQQGGKKIVERNRYQLDFRHEAVRKHLDQVVDRLVTKMGVGYFKFDYNIEISQGTDVHGCSPGVGQLEHNRAYLAWVTSLLDKYPGLVIENCSSGAQRMDYAMLAVHPLQSTSDQEDPVMYASIAAAVFTAVTPEQSATWAYPQKEWSDEINALTVVNSLLGRIHLSGRLDLLSDHQFNLIAEGMNIYKSIRQDIKNGVPFWPLGLPTWREDWLAVGLICTDRTLLAVWRTNGKNTCELPISHLSKQGEVEVTLLYPKSFAAEARWDATVGAVQVQLPETVCARVFEIKAR